MAGRSRDSQDGTRGGSADAGGTRERLLAAAREAFAYHGVRGATTRAIAEAAGVSEMTLFRHFPTKRDLLVAVLEQYSSFSVFNEELDRRLTWNLEDDLATIASVFLGMTDASTLPMLASIVEALRDPELRPLVAGPPRAQQEYVARYLREQARRGGCRRLGDYRLVGGAFLAMFFEHSIAKAVYYEDAPDRDAAIAELVGLFVRALRP